MPKFSAHPRGMCRVTMHLFADQKPPLEVAAAELTSARGEEVGYSQIVREAVDEWLQKHQRSRVKNADPDRAA